jgi:hypothetical protein
LQQHAFEVPAKGTEHLRLQQPFVTECVFVVVQTRHMQRLQIEKCMVMRHCAFSQHLQLQQCLIAGCVSVVVQTHHTQR